MLSRVLEPEVMDGDEQCEAYARADFTEPNQAFLAQLREAFAPTSGHLIDLGCGPADIPVELALSAPDLRITAVDASAAMLRWAQSRIDEAELSERLHLVLGRLPEVLDRLDGPFDGIMSNSLLHHLPLSEVLWSSIRALAHPGTWVLVVDLRRPESLEEVERIVETHSGDAPEVLRKDFYNSLLAAFSVEEVRHQLDAAGLSHLRVEATTDRHLAVWGRVALTSPH